MKLDHLSTRSLHCSFDMLGIEEVADQRRARLPSPRPVFFYPPVPTHVSLFLLTSYHPWFFSPLLFYSGKIDRGRFGFQFFATRPETLRRRRRRPAPPRRPAASTPGAVSEVPVPAPSPKTPSRAPVLALAPPI